MNREEAEQEMMDGYLDGFDFDTPEPSDNRSHSYRHGFWNGRADRVGKVRDTAQALRELAEASIAMDACL